MLLFLNNPSSVSNQFYNSNYWVECRKRRETALRQGRTIPEEHYGDASWNASIRRGATKVCVDPNGELVSTARSSGICFGDPEPALRRRAGLSPRKEKRDAAELRLSRKTRVVS